MGRRSDFFFVRKKRRSKDDQVMDRKHSSSYWIEKEKKMEQFPFNWTLHVFWFCFVVFFFFSRGVHGSSGVATPLDLRQIVCVLCSHSGVVVHLLSHWEIRDVSGISSDVKKKPFLILLLDFYSSYQTICLYIFKDISVVRPSVGLLCMHSFSLNPEPTAV